MIDAGSSPATCTKNMIDERKKAFYVKVGKILEIEVEYKIPFSKRNRWTNRTLGNGRFPGFGLVRCFGDERVIVTSKHGTRYFDNFNTVYNYLESLK